MTHNQQSKQRDAGDANTSPQFGTLGIVVDLHDEEGRKLAQETMRQTGCPEFCKLLSMAQTLGQRYVVAAGRFDGKGISGTICDETQHLVAAFQMMNARMDEIGSRTTAWMIKPDSCAALLEKVFPHSQTGVL